MKYHLSMRSYNEESKTNSKNKNFPDLMDSGKKQNLAKASQSASNFYNVSKSKIRNKYREETNEKVDFSNKNHAKEFLLKTKSKSKVANYDSYMMPPTANDVQLFSSRTSFNSFK